MSRTPIPSMLTLAFISTAPMYLVAATAAAETPPNVIVFLAGDLGHGDLACLGHPRIQTPNLDAFARQGTVDAVLRDE